MISKISQECLKGSYEISRKRRCYNMRNCHHRCRPRPCCRPCCENHDVGGGGSGGSRCVETIVEPTVHCRSDHHHHRRVRHIIPVVHHRTHHHHTHREWEVRRRHTQEHAHHEHGRRPGGDLCNFGREERHGHGHGRGCDQGQEFDSSSFDQGNDCGSEMFM